MGSRVPYAPTTIDAVVVWYIRISSAPRTPISGTVGHINNTRHNTIYTHVRVLLPLSKSNISHNHVYGSMLPIEACHLVCGSHRCYLPFSLYLVRLYHGGLTLAQVQGHGIRDAIERTTLRLHHDEALLATLEGATKGSSLSSRHPAGKHIAISIPIGQIIHMDYAVSLEHSISFLSIYNYTLAWGTDNGKPKQGFLDNG